MLQRAAVVCLLAVGTLSNAHAQTTHLVGPAGFAQIRDAIAIAAPGDIITVHPGTYWNFDLDVGVTIRAELPGTVQIAFDANTPSPGPTTITLPANQQAHLVDLELAASVLALPTPVHHYLRIVDSNVTMDACSLHSVFERVVDAADAQISLQYCQVSNDAASGTTSPHGDGIYAERCILSICGGEVSGSAASAIGSKRAINLLDCTLHASNFTALAGTSSQAIIAYGSTIWITHSVLDASLGSCAISASGNQPIIQFTQLIQSGVSCGGSGPGADQLGVRRSAPLQLGTTFSAEFQTTPNGFVAIFASHEARTTLLPGFENPTYLNTSSLIQGPLLFANPAGSCSASWQVPNLLALRNQTLWLQGCTGLSWPLQLSPVLGGVVR